MLHCGSTGFLSANAATLLDMLRFYAEKFSRAIRLLTELSSLTKDRQVIVDGTLAEFMKSTLGDLREQCSGMELDASEKAVSRLWESIKAGRPAWENGVLSRRYP